MSNLRTWAKWSVAAVLLLSPVLAFLMVIAVEALIDLVLEVGVPAMLNVMAVGAILWVLSSQASESLLHARRRTRRRKRSAFRALHRAHPRRRAGVRIPFPPPAKGGPDSQTLPFARNTHFLRYCFYGTMTTRINFV